MLAAAPRSFLVATADSNLEHPLEPILAVPGARIVVARTGDAAFDALLAPQLPQLVLLDAEMPGLDLDQLLAATRTNACGQRCVVVLLADEVRPEWSARVADGALDDLVPRDSANPQWRLRLEIVVRRHERMHELEELREAMTMQAQLDPLTRVYNRSTMLSMLFRETDRVQRMKTPLCLSLLDLDDFGHWNSRLGTEACDELLCRVAERIGRLLRSYDLLGRTGKDEFLVVLPGCSTVDAVLLTERLRTDVFAVPFHAAGESIRLSACFGIASSQGRSPIVVLREAEMALVKARSAGPESIRCFGNCPERATEPVAFLSDASGDELLAW